MSGRILWVLAALALGLALLMGVLWHSDTPRATAAAPEERPRRALPAAEPDAPKDPQRAEPGVEAWAPTDGAGVDLLPSVRRPASGVVRPAPVRVENLVLHGRVRAPVEDLANVELELALISRRAPEPLRAACAPDGSYRIEAAGLLPQLAQPPDTLQFELRARHSDCLPSSVAFQVSHVQRAERGGEPPTFAWRDGTTSCELDVSLEPASRVRGQLVGVADPRRFALAAVRLHDGRPTPPWLAIARPDSQGAFEFQLPRGADCALVVAGDGFRPAFVEVELDRPRARELSISPDRGVRLEGVVRLAAEIPREEFQLELLWSGDLGDQRPRRWDRLAPDQDELCWVDGAFEWRRHHVRTSAGGRFAFDGLAPREYELRVLGVGVPGVELRAWSVGHLRAPAYGLALGPVLSSVDFDLGPVVDSAPSFVLVDERSARTLRLGPFTTDALGRAQVHLPPGRHFSVIVGDALVGRLSTPAAGESARFALAR